MLACLASWNIEKQVKGYFALYLLLMASMMGVFLSLDLFLFYVFFEVMLLPMYFLIGIWGGPRREYAAIKFLLYTLFGSVFILVAILILYFYAGRRGGAPASRRTRSTSSSSRRSPPRPAITAATSSAGSSCCSSSASCVKLPSFPFHTWLPDAHVEAPTPISMILAGILLKIGGYGLIRLAWPLAPAGALRLLVLRGRAGRLQHPLRRPGGDGPDRLQEAGRLQLGQPHGLRDPGHGRDEPAARDPRYYAYGVNGAMFMMLAHGITSAGMFFLVGVIYDRAHTRDLNKLGGLNNIMPLYGAISYIIFFGSMGLPGLCGFVAEVFVVLAAFNYNPWLGGPGRRGGDPDGRLHPLDHPARLPGPERDLEGPARHEPPRDDHRGAAGRADHRAWAIFPQWLVLSWMGPSVDRMVQKVMTARTLNVQPGQIRTSLPPSRPAGTLASPVSDVEPRETSGAPASEASEKPAVLTLR